MEEITFFTKEKTIEYGQLNEYAMIFDTSNALYFVEKNDITSGVLYFILQDHRSHVLIKTFLNQKLEQVLEITNAWNKNTSK